MLKKQQNKRVNKQVTFEVLIAVTMKGNDDTSHPNRHRQCQASTNFPKVQEPHPNSRCQKGNMKKVPYQEPTILQ
jgi:hypothetical protein